MTIIDLFSGCGGFGLGAELAGFRTVAAIDVDPTLQSSYKLNFPHVSVLNQDLSATDEGFWKSILTRKKIDGVLGGPPCQGYSRMGHSDITDERRSLLMHFFRNVNMIMPKFFIMENVEGLIDKKNADELEKATSLIDKRYRVLPPFIIDAANCGAPTHRRRVILIGYLPRYISTLKTEDFFFSCEKKITVKDAISDLPNPVEQDESNQFGFGVYPPQKHISNYASELRELPQYGLGWDVMVENLQSGKVSGCFDTVHTREVAHRYKTTKQGQTEKISRSKKLAWEGLAPTLRAGTGSDKGSHQAVRPLHPDEGRVITVREAARLQGFPDWFTFHPTKWHSFRMIGNSVSPLVSRTILNIIKSRYKIKNVATSYGG